MEYPRSISSCEKSVSAVPSLTEPCRLLDPETNARASTRLVLPLAPWPTTATFRISELLYSRMVHAPFEWSLDVDALARRARWGVGARRAREEVVADAMVRRARGG